MSKRKEWKRKDARDAWYIIKYYKPGLKLNTVSITDKSTDKRYSYKGQKVSNKLGDYGLFITFKRKNMGIGEKLPYFTNGWGRPLTLMSAIKRFFVALQMYDSMAKVVKKWNSSMFDEKHVSKKGTTRNKALTNILKEIQYISYWSMDKKGTEGRIRA